jgi:uncharacterized protein YkwD
MSNSIHSLQTENAQAQTEQTVQPPKKLQQATQSPTPQDTVTISKASQQAHAGNTRAAVGGDKDHDGDSA